MKYFIMPFAVRWTARIPRGHGQYSIPWATLRVMIKGIIACFERQKTMDQLPELPDIIRQYGVASFDGHTDGEDGGSSFWSCKNPGVTRPAGFREKQRGLSPVSDWLGSGCAGGGVTDRGFSASYVPVRFFQTAGVTGVSQLLIVISAGYYWKIIPVDIVHKSVLFIYSSGPEAGKILSQSFGITDTLKRRSYEDTIHSFQCFSILLYSFSCLQFCNWFYQMFCICWIPAGNDGSCIIIWYFVENAL